MCTINEDHDIWFMKYKVRQTKLFVILGHFLDYQPPDNPENQNFKIIFCHFGPFFAVLPIMDPEYQNFEKEKKKKNPEDNIILQMHTINDSHMMHGF